MKGIARLMLAVHAAWLLAASPATAQQGYEFMPEGGKALLLRLLGTPPDADALRSITQATRSEAAWRDFLQAREDGLNDAALRTLAAYLAVSMPLAPGALEQARQKGDLAAALPADGRELAWNYCQFCHSLFSSYLTQDRDVQGWLSTFETPFHREIGMDTAQQQIFARYSAINMPLAVDQVPEELRF